MTNKNFSDLLASEMLTKLASKENREIFGSDDLSFAKDKKGNKCKNCGCHEDECQCGDMAYSDDGDTSSEVDALARTLEDFNNDCDEKCMVRLCFKPDEDGNLHIEKCEDLDGDKDSLDKDASYSSEFELPGKEHAKELDAKSLAKSLLEEKDQNTMTEETEESTHTDGDGLEAAASYLLSASDALDSAGLHKSASVALKLASLVITAAKKKKAPAKSTKEDKKDAKKNTKKDTKDSAKSSKKTVSTKSTKSSGAKKEEPSKQTKTTKSSGKTSLPKKK